LLASTCHFIQRDFTRKREKYPEEGREGETLTDLCKSTGLEKYAHDKKEETNGWIKVYERQRERAKREDASRIQGVYKITI
jgi:hypothetical protein